MVRRYLMATLALIIAVPALAADRPAYPCYPVEQAPEIDGIVADDPAWAAVPRVTGFHALGGGYTEAKQTTAMACRDADNLYVAMICEEPDIEQVRSLRGDGDALYTEDSVEIFVMPDPVGEIFQFVVSAGGAQTGAKAAELVDGWEGTARRGEASYSVEVRIPLQGLGSDVDEDWRIAFGRNTWTTDSGGDKFTCWPALRAAFHEPQSYAGLDFRGQRASAELRGRAEAALNSNYRAHLVAQVTALAPAGARYLPTLKQTAEDDEHPLQHEALEAVLTWMRIERAARDAASADLSDLRDAAVLARRLKAQSHQLAWQARMEKLLGAYGR